MTLETIYYIGQTVAVGAILASLVAIWFQMRQSQKMERATAQRDLLDRVSMFTRSMTQDEADLWLLGLHDLTGASSGVDFMMDKKTSEFLLLTEAAFNMHNDGFFTDGTWTGIEGYMISILRTPGGQQYWDYKKNVIGFEISKHLTARMNALGPDIPTVFETQPYMQRRLNELLDASGKHPSEPSAAQPEAEPPEHVPTEEEEPNT